MSYNTREFPLSATDGQGLIRSLFTVYGVILIAGVVLLRHFALESGLRMNFDRCVFWAINAMTCTGFRASPNGLPEFSTAGLIIIYALVLAGSMIAMIIGGILVSRYAGLEHSSSRIVAGTCFVMLTASLLGAGVLMSQDRSFGESIFDATNAIANAGMSIGDVRAVDDWRLQLVVLPLAALGGLGITILIEIYDRLVVHKPMSRHSSRMLRLAAWAWLVCFALLLAANSSLPWRENVVSSWTYAINSRSLGAHVPAGFGRAAWWLVGLFILAGSVGGSAGGIRLGTFATLGRQVRTAMTGERASPILGLLVGWIVIFCGLGLVLFILLLSAEPDLSADRLWLLATGALGNTGISHEPVSLSTRGLALLSAAMVAGHLLPLQFAAWWIEPEPER